MTGTSVMKELIVVTLYIASKNLSHQNSRKFMILFAKIQTVLVAKLVLECWKKAKIIYRTSLPEVFCKKGVLRNFAKFTGKHLCQRPATLLKKNKFATLLKILFFLTFTVFPKIYCG